MGKIKRNTNGSYVAIDDIISGEPVFELEENECKHKFVYAFKEQSAGELYFTQKDVVVCEKCGETRRF